MTEKHGAIVRDAGTCDLVTDLEAHRMDWNRAVRIILNVLIQFDGDIVFSVMMLKSSNFVLHQ